MSDNSKKPKGDAKGDALAMSPYAGLVHSSKRPPLPRLPKDFDPIELSPYAAMFPKLKPKTKTKEKEPAMAVPKTWLGKQKKKQ